MCICQLNTQVVKKRATVMHMELFRM